MLRVPGPRFCNIGLFIKKRTYQKAFAIRKMKKFKSEYHLPVQNELKNLVIEDIPKFVLFLFEISCKKMGSHFGDTSSLPDSKREFLKESLWQRLSGRNSGRDLGQRFLPFGFIFWFYRTAVEDSELPDKSSLSMSIKSATGKIFNLIEYARKVMLI